LGIGPGPQPSTLFCVLVWATSFIEQFLFPVNTAKTICEAKHSYSFVFASEKIGTEMERQMEMRIQMEINMEMGDVRDRGGGKEMSG
jgi:hypothetical protein